MTAVEDVASIEVDAQTAPSDVAANEAVGGVGAAGAVAVDGAMGRPRRSLSL